MKSCRFPEEVGHAPFRVRSSQGRVRRSPFFLLKLLGFCWLGAQVLPAPPVSASSLLGGSEDKGTIGITEERGVNRRGHLPRRIVLALDGVSYRDVERMQWDGEIFRDFHPVSRNVSTFPSISDVSWADIFRTEAPNGYQRYHYSIGRNQIVGGSMSDLGNPIEYERRMHLAFEELGHHLHSYLFAADAAEVEIREIERRFFAMRDQAEVFYVYVLSTDTLQHTGGDIRGLLRSLDAGLRRMKRRYREETGDRLEILMVSDHGHNHVGNGQRLPIEEIFLANGFRKVTSLRNPGDVVYTTAGILNSLALYASDSDLDRLETLLLRTQGVDLVSRVGRREGSRGTSFDDVTLSSAAGKGSARIRQVAPDRYSYESIEGGDPLDYAPVIQQLRHAGKFEEATQSARSSDWLEATLGHLYPAAPERIYRGHRFITKNPSKLIVSLVPGFENADPTVKWMTHFKRRGGTHGSLRADDSLGILLSNFQPTRDTTTQNVARQFEFLGMRNYESTGRGARFYGSEATGWDYLAREAVADGNPLLDPQNLFLNLWDAQAPSFEAMGLATQYRVRVREKPGAFLQGRPLKVDRVFDAASLPKTLARTEYRLAWNLIFPDQGMEPGIYELEVRAERFSRTASRIEASERVANLSFVVTTDGQTLPF